MKGLASKQTQKYFNTWVKRTCRHQLFVVRIVQTRLGSKWYFSLDILKQADNVQHISSMLELPGHEYVKKSLNPCLPQGMLKNNRYKTHIDTSSFRLTDLFSRDYIMWGRITHNSTQWSSGNWQQRGEALLGWSYVARCSAGRAHCTENGPKPEQAAGLAISAKHGL